MNPVTKLSIKIAFLILFYLSFLAGFTQPATLKKDADLAYYKWYGKRFDWKLDIYGKNPTHRDSIQLFMSEMGEGKDSFLVLHGGWGAEHSYLLDALLPLANKAHFIFYDQRGSLRSSCADSVISANDHINDIERIRKALGMERINLVGHSMGTWLAAAYLDKYPERTGKMILISGLALLINNTDDADRALSRQYSDSVHKSRWSFQPQYWAEVLKRNGLDTNSKKSDFDKVKRNAFSYMQQFWSASGTISDYKNWEKDNKGSTFLYREDAANPATRSMPKRWNFSKAFGQHQFPITIIKAAGDYLSPALLEKSVKGMQNVSFVLIKNAGHNPWLEQPGKFRKEMKKALLR